MNREFNEQLNNWKIWCTEGHYITSYTEDQPISNFSSFKVAYCPASTDIDAKYHCITEEENSRYLELLRKWEEEQRREDEKDLGSYSE